MLKIEAKTETESELAIMVPLRKCLWLVALTALLPLNAGQAGAAEALRKGDALNITVFGEESLSGMFAVSETGELSFPLLGRLAVVGKSPQEVEEEIERLLEVDLIRDAEVSASFANREALSVIVIGDVRSPGKVAIPESGGLDLLTAIASSGGFTETSDPEQISIRSSGQRRGETVSKSGARRVLLPGDTVVVQSKGKAETIAILGEVKSPGSVELPASGELDLLTAIAEAGGFTPRARPSKVTVRRKSASNSAEVETVNVSKLQKEDGETYLLRAGDVVVIPVSIF